MIAALLERAKHPLVMGVLNVTPDSFSDGGAFLDCEQALAHADRMIAGGADIIDVGGESTRPGSSPVTADEQIRRTQPVIARIAERHPDVPISIDTQSAPVAAAALEVGASIVNDISALRGDSAMIAVVAKRRADVILMHMQGTPEKMQDAPRYDDVLGEIEAFLRERLEFCLSHGVSRDSIVIDPGIGFGKTLDNNLAILGGLQRFVALAPVLVGTSRKSFLGKLLGLDDPADRLTGTTVTHAVALLAGVSILRVHDVPEARQVIEICAALQVRS